MAMTLSLSDEQTEALRRRAEAEHRSIQQVALAAIDAYLNQPDARNRRKSVPVSELHEIFGGLPPMDAAEFRADQERYVDGDAYFDADLRAKQSGSENSE
ncbi:ribbon-helix-helix protein, CopG family [Nocardia arthritidis]|uniref:Ribbon-helix-helix protein, CopG family n=1 Tax=Nocardia arthritidis TaxID=228602 RepID=A0A6G9YJV2_9NOCA|nr:ribbon-helix-helix protein, CopG family [Nocardia arthritidis]QIS13482.1 ribbon-helix-helix protein, CopG family [Nocardia arthritidis]